MRNNEKFITKKRLFWHIIRWNLLLTIAATLFLIFLFIWVIGYWSNNIDDLVDGILLLLMYSFILITIVYSTFIPVRRIFKSIKKQEEILGFSFNDEMKRQRFQKLPIHSSQWFISKHAVYHRDFVVEVKNLAVNQRRNRSSVIIIGKNETKAWLCADVLQFVEWVKKVNKDATLEFDTTEKIRVDRLNEYPQPKGRKISTFFTGFFIILLLLFIIDNGRTLIRRDLLLQDVTRTTAIVVRANSGRGRNSSPDIRVSFEANGRQHTDRIRVPLSSVAIGDEIEIYFANEDNCVIMAAENDLARGHYIYMLVIGSFLTLGAGIGFLTNIHALIISRKIKKNGEDWWSERVKNSKRKSKNRHEIRITDVPKEIVDEKEIEKAKKYIEKGKAFLLKHQHKIINKTNFPTEHLRESTKMGRFLIQYPNYPIEELDIKVMRFYGRTELVINGLVYEEKLGGLEKSYELGAQVSGYKINFINLISPVKCYVYILIDDEIVSMFPRDF